MRVPYSSHMSRFIQSALVFAAANLTVVSATIAETLDTHREHSASFEESAVLFLAAQTGEPPSQISIMIGDSRLRIPNCPREWLFEADKPSKNLISAECTDSQWKVALRYEVSGSAADQRTGHDLSLGSGRASLLHDLDRGHKLQVEDFTSDAIVSLPQELEALIDSGVFMKVSAVAGTTVSASMLDRGQHVLIARENISIGRTVTEKDFSSAIVASIESANAIPTDYFFGDNTKAIAGILKGEVVSEKAVGHPVDVLVAKTLIRPGEIFTNLNTELQAILTDAPDGAVSDLTSLGRSVATSQIQPGRILRYIDARREEDIKKGEEIRLTVSRGSFHLEMDVIALESAFIGDAIKLTNPESGATITATVSGKRSATK